MDAKWVCALIHHHPVEQFPWNPFENSKICKQAVSALFVHENISKSSLKFLKRSFERMIDDYFERLRTQAQKIDERTQKLSEIWKTPYSVIGGYGSYSSEADGYANALRADLKTMMEEMSAEEELRTQRISQMDTFLEESTNSYTELLQECDDIESVLMEYGYTQLPEVGINADGSNHASNLDSSLIPLDVTDDLLEVEFTPNMTWRQKSRTTTSKSTTPNGVNSLTESLSSPELPETQTCIATPVIKSLASVMESHTPLLQNIARKCTPLKKCPEPPVFSSHFYNIMKK